MHGRPPTWIRQWKLREACQKSSWAVDGVAWPSPPFFFFFLVHDYCWRWHTADANNNISPWPHQPLPFLTGVAFLLWCLRASLARHPHNLFIYLSSLSQVGSDSSSKPRLPTFRERSWTGTARNTTPHRTRSCKLGCGPPSYLVQPAFVTHRLFSSTASSWLSSSLLTIYIYISPSSSSSKHVLIAAIVIHPSIRKLYRLSSHQPLILSPARRVQWHTHRLRI